MSPLISLIFILCILCGMNTLANAQPVQNDRRGELLYSTHCQACHTTEIHWREQKLATDWGSLKAQVSRWQANIGLAWSEEDITDVAYFLNNNYYKFLNTEQKVLSQDKASKRILQKY
jgi:hypothetical protein